MAKAVFIVLDGLGVGGAPDAGKYGDEGSDTLGNMAAAVGGLDLPTLERLGLGNLHNIAGVVPVEAPAACYGRLQEVSAGKDSTTGHWELAGLKFRHESSIPFAVVVRKIRNPFLRRLIDSKRSFQGTNVILAKGSVREMLKALKKGYFIATLIDQNTKVREGGISDRADDRMRTALGRAQRHADR